MGKKKCTMEKITFWIGNGFDVNVGLHTRYQDFYDYYTPKHTDDLIADAIAVDKLTDGNNWSDLEIALGNFTEEVEKRWENADGFWKSLQTMQSELILYLKNEAAKVTLTGERK